MKLLSVIVFFALVGCSNNRQVDHITITKGTVYHGDTCGCLAGNYVGLGCPNPIGELTIIRTDTTSMKRFMTCYRIR